jgi:CubicO group peptidase (beta-lactamase class C family)
MRKLILAIIILASTFVRSSAQTDTVAVHLQALMKQYDAVGLSVAVVKHNRIIYSRSFGIKNKETGQLLSENDIFRIASISKSFLATSMMQLVESDKVSLDDEFGKLIGSPIRNPHYPDVPITLRMIMSHSSSINDKNGYFDLDVINPAKNPDWAISYSDNRPGSTYDYCNLNFNMAGAVIERLTGQRYDQYVVQHILKPLGLYGGYCVDSLDSSLFATLYDYDSTKTLAAQPNAYNPRRKELGNYTLGYSTPVLSPTGGMKISALNLAKYMMMHMNYGKSNGVRIISKRSSKTMQSIISPTENYGLALLNTTKLIPGRTMVGHTGSAYGLYSMMFFDPKKKCGVVLITNGCRPAYRDGFIEFLELSARELFNSLIE